MYQLLFFLLLLCIFDDVCCVPCLTLGCTCVHSNTMLLTFSDCDPSLFVTLRILIPLSTNSCTVGLNWNCVLPDVIASYSVSKPISSLIIKILNSLHTMWWRTAHRSEPINHSASSSNANNDAALLHILNNLNAQTYSTTLTPFLSPSLSLSKPMYTLFLFLCFLFLWYFMIFITI